jgi:hypothetical protein
MNTKCLAGHYETLTPRERYPLMVAARDRGDAVEAERLEREAPFGTFSVPNYRGMAEGMADISLLHLIELLDMAAKFWQVNALLESIASGREKVQKAMKDGLRKCRGLWGYLYGVETEAWRRFCTELHLDPDGFIRDLPGYPTTKQAEEIVRLFAFTPDEAVQAIRETSPEGTKLYTVESALANFKAALASREKRWG